METLDLTGLRCPLPLLKLKQRLHQLPTTAELLVLTTDSGALRDFPLFLGQAGHQLLRCDTDAAGISCFHIRKG